MKRKITNSGEQITCKLVFFINIGNQDPCQGSHGSWFNHQGLEILKENTNIKKANYRLTVLKD